jgi:hypothetical protein
VLKDDDDPGTYEEVMDAAVLDAFFVLFLIPEFSSSISRNDRVRYNVAKSDKKESKTKKRVGGIESSFFPNLTL